MSETAIDYGSRTMPHDDVAEQSCSVHAAVEGRYCGRG